MDNVNIIRTTNSKVPMKNPAISSDVANRALRFLESNNTFSTLNALELETLLVNLSVIALKRNQILWEPQTNAKNVYLVRNGVIREYIPDVEDRPVTVGLHARQDLIGLGAAMNVNEHTTVAIAHEDCVLYAISGATLDNLTQQNPMIGKAIAQLVFQRMKKIQHRIPDLINKTAHSRLATVLLDLATKFGIRDSRGIIINIKLTHRVIASLIGTTRETVSFAIVDLRRAGLIQNDGKRFIITQSEALTGLADSGEIETGQTQT